MLHELAAPHSAYNVSPVFITRDMLRKVVSFSVNARSLNRIMVSARLPALGSRVMVTVWADAVMFESTICLTIAEVAAGTTYCEVPYVPELEITAGPANLV
jgi:hypothetical protein|tara:strand:+ start:2122 stop:2424 length:303 start_codon:yes stop_codon:yes gene_type:complete